LRTALPGVSWKVINRGVSEGKARAAQVEDTCGKMEGLSGIDDDIVQLNGDGPAVRLSEDRAFIEAMSQEFASKIIYGNTNTDPEEILGLAPRYNSLSAANGENIIDAGGTGSTNTSVWLVCWGDETLHGIYPKGTQAGITVDDLGKQLVEDGITTGSKILKWFTKIGWNCGLTVKDWRYAVRVANIDVTALTVNAVSGADLIEKMIRAMHKIKNRRMGKLVWYANETVETFLDLQTLNKSNLNVTYRDGAHGEPVLTFRGIPVRRVDELVSTEARVV
jgi:hypothetical protein